jgi:hypothetical protein
MAKSKKPKKDEEEIVEEPEAEEEAKVDEEPAEDVEVDTEDVEADAADADADVEADADVDADAEGEDIAAEADDDDKEKAEDGDDDDKDEESIDETPAAPTPKTTVTAMVLIFLNLIMAVVFLSFVYLDYMSRVKAQYRTVVNYVKIWGLPLKQEEESSSVAVHTRPVIRLTPEQLQRAFGERGTKVSITPDKFQAVEEETALHIRPSDMTEMVLGDVFYGGISNPVPTLEDEILRLKTALPGMISETATEVADALVKKPEADKRTFVKNNLAISGDAAQVKALQEQIDGAGGAALDDFVKRAAVQRTLFTMAFSVAQIDKLDEMLQTKKGADLDKLVNESLQRRLYYDILAPLNVFRPGDLGDAKKRFEIENLADQSVTIDDLKRFLEKRLDASIAEQYQIDDAHLGKEFWNKAQPSELTRARDSNEKRKHVGFILFNLSQLQKPLIGAKVFPQGVERAQVCSGLYEFTNASVQYVTAMNILEGRIARAIEADRQGLNLISKDGKVVRTPGAVDIYELEVERLVKLRERLEIALDRREVAKKQRDHINKIYNERAKQYRDTLDRLISERARTEKYAKELRELQAQLHEALVNLADAGERNFQIEAEIRAIEMEYIRRTQPKGVKQP